MTNDAHPITCPRCGLTVSAEDAFCEHCGAQLAARKPHKWYHLHRRVYDWTLAWAYRPSASVALFVLSFAESSFFPVPPDVLLAPLVLGNRKRWARYALLCSLASVLGAVAGFCIGWLLWDQAGVSTLFYRYVPGFTPEVFQRVSRLYQQYNFFIVFTAGFTPIPFKVITITAGVFGTGPAVGHPPVFFAVFLLAAVVSRSARFFLVAGLMRLFGPKITPFIERYFNWLSLAFVALLIGGFVVIKYIL
jgi:membrane protein YqaA with SNARE-associated domain